MDPQDSALTGPGRRVEIRLAASGELDAVAEMLVAVFSPIASRMPAAVASRYLEQVRDVRSRAATSELLVAVDRDGGLAGSVTFLPDSAHDEHPWPEGGAVLRLLAVVPEARATGVGQSLVEACIDRARRHGRAFVGLHTSDVMEEARALYERLGFIRAPAWDFDARAHYGSAGSDAELRGLAYVLPFD